MSNDDQLSANKLLFDITAAINKVEQDWNENKISGSRPAHLAYAAKQAIDLWYGIYVDMLKRTCEAIRKKERESHKG